MNKLNEESNKFLKIVELYGWNKYYFLDCLIEEYGQEQLLLWLEAYQETKRKDGTNENS